MASHPDTQKTARALMQLDLVVGHEHFLTPTARYADVVLPATTFLERNGTLLHAPPDREALTLHPADATARGLSDCDSVLAYNHRGACRVPLRVSDTVLPGVALLPAGAWPDWKRAWTRLPQHADQRRGDRLGAGVDPADGAGGGDTVAPALWAPVARPSRTPPAGQTIARGVLAPRQAGVWGTGQNRTGDRERCLRSNCRLRPGPPPEQPDIRQQLQLWPGKSSLAAFQACRAHTGPKPTAPEALFSRKT